MTEPAKAGLDGVIVGNTSIGEVQGERGFYHYRQYSAVELANQCSLEEIWYLLVAGELPTASQLDEFTDKQVEFRSIPRALTPIFNALAATNPRPIDALRTAVSSVGSVWEMRPSLDIDSVERQDDGIRLCSVMPTLVAHLHRQMQGLDPIEPNPQLSYATNALFMLSGKIPEPDIARAFEQYLISTVDHGFNVSTFTARTITSTGADVASAVVGAIGALSGPLHGGAPGRVLDMLDELDSHIEEPDSIKTWIRHRIEKRQKIMGFGHRLYRDEDPRAVLMRAVAVELGGTRVEQAIEVERQVHKALDELKPGHQIGTNIEFYAGVVMERCGIPSELFTPMFACSRAIGWCAHIVEQAQEARLIRPTAQYVGPEVQHSFSRSR